MRAAQLARPFTVVGPDTDAMDAARSMAAERLPGLIVCDADGRPWTVLPGSQVLRFLIPAYIQDDPALARAVNEDDADRMCRRLTKVTVRELLPAARDLDELPVVDADATSLEVAAVMARMHSPLVAVTDGARVIGAITVSALLEHLLPREDAS